MVSGRRGGVGRAPGPPLRAHLDPRSFADDSDSARSFARRTKLLSAGRGKKNEKYRLFDSHREKKRVHATLNVYASTSARRGRKGERERFFSLSLSFILLSSHRAPLNRFL